MASTKQARRPASPSQADKPKKGKCVDCAHAYVMTDHMPQNPLISICGQNNERFSQGHVCQINGFEPRKGELVIHEMIYLNRD